MSEGHEPWTYVIRVMPDGPFKIGYATNVRHRLSSFQTGNHKDLRIIWLKQGGAQLETKLHRVFSKLWVRGEWFDAGDMTDDQIVDMIEKSLEEK